MANTKIGLDEKARHKFFEEYGKERVYWSGRYRHTTKAHWYIVALFLIVGIVYLALKWSVWLLWLLLVPLSILMMALMQPYTHTFEITNKRLEVKECGAFCTPYLYYIEYYEIRSVKVELYGRDKGHFIFETQNMELPTIRSPRIDKISKIHKMVKEMMERSRTYMEHMEKQGHLRD